MLNKKSSGLDALKNASVEHEKSENKINYSTLNNVIMAFHVDKELILFIKKLVFFKINEDVNSYHYNESEAVREGINLMRLTMPNLKERPAEIENPTRKGRRTTNSGIVKVKTSFLVSENDKQFFYNLVYDRQKGGGTFTKEDFLKLIVEHLQNNYNLK